MLNKFLAIIVVALFAAGCGVQAHTYTVTKERVGITDAGGNVGYLTGKGTFQEPEKKTRDIYVLELSKAASIPKGKNVVGAPAAATASTSTETTTTTTVVTTETVIAPVETYTVLKDDTLQKISKKVYGTYSKWYKIYEANKDRIKDPNFLKAGTVLTIPAVK